MISSVSFQRVHWFLNFDPNSILLTVKGLFQGMSILSTETCLPAWNLLSQTQDFLGKHSVRNPVSPNQRELHGKKRRFSLELELKSTGDGDQQL